MLGAFFAGVAYAGQEIPLIVLTAGTKTQTAIARVAATKVITQTSLARIAKLFAITQLAKSRLGVNFTKTQSSIAHIQQTLTKTQTSVARVQLTKTKTQAAVARINPNRISNPGFESGIGGWSVYGGISTIASSSIVSHTGSKSLQLIGDGTVWAGAYLVLTSGQVTGDQNLFRVWVLGDSLTAGHFVQAVLKDEVGSTTQVSVPVMLSSTVWKEIWVTWVMPATGNMSIQVQGIDLVVGSVYLDDVSLTYYNTPAYTVSSRTIRKNGVVANWRGWTYSNIAQGNAAGTSWATEKKQVRYDMEDIASGGGTAVKIFYDGYVFADYSASLDEAYRNGVDVIMNYFVPYSTDYSVATGGTNRTTQISAFAAMVTALKVHPAIIGFAFGSENNYNLGSTSKADWYSMLDAAIVSGKSSDNGNHLFTTSNGETADVATYDSSVSHLDFWGVTLYRSTTFTTLSSDVTSATTRPLIITEYGFDDYNSTVPAEDQSGQSSRNLALSKEAESYLSVVSGHFLFEFADEWWKMGNNSTHDTTGVSNVADDRDGMFQEEWFGSTVALATGSAQYRTKRQSYTDLSTFYNGFVYGTFGGTKTQTSTARVGQTGTKTQTSIARISAVPTKTQTAVSRVATISTKTQSSIGRIAKTSTKTQTAIARAAINLTKAQTAVARVAKVTTKTQTATGRTALNKAVTQTAIARVALISTKAQTSIARIANNSSKTQSAIANIVTASIKTKTQTAIGRVAVNVTKTQSTVARIVATPSKTQTAVARVAKTITKTQSAVANIITSSIRTKTQTAIARAAVNLTKTQTVVSRIIATPTKLQSSIGRIAINFTKTQGAIGRIAKTVTKTQSATGRVAGNVTKAQSVTSRIAQATSKTQSSIARIVLPGSKTQTSVARIATASTKTQSAVGRVAKNLTKTEPAIARVANNLTKTQSSVGRVAKNLTKTQSAVANVVNSSIATKNQTATAHIKAVVVKTQPAIGRIAGTVSKTQSTTARIANNRTKTQAAIGRVATNLSKTQTAIGRISRNFTKTQPALGRIAQTTIKTQPAVGRVAANLSKNQLALGRIALAVIKPQTAIARIATNKTKTQLAVGQTFYKTQTSLAHIEKNLTKTQTATASIIPSVVVKVDITLGNPQIQIQLPASQVINVSLPNTSNVCLSLPVKQATVTLDSATISITEQ